MSEFTARNGGWAGLLALIAILLLGLGLRVDNAWEGRAPVYDAAAYARIAANLEQGHGFSLGQEATQPASNYSPGLPLFTAALYELTGGTHERFARLVLAVIGALAVPFAYLIGRRLGGPAAGLIGAAAIAVHPALLEYQGMLMSEPLAATLLSGAILAMLSANERAGRPRVRWLLPGLLLGALALVRPEYLGVAVLLAVVVFAGGLSGQSRQGAWRQSLSAAAILLAGIALVVAPWTMRNAIVLERFVPVSTGAGQVLFAGSYMPSDGDPEKVGEEVLRRHPELLRELARRYLGGERRHRAGAAPANAATQAAMLRAVLKRVRMEQILAVLAARRYPDLASDQALARMGRERLWENASERPLAYLSFLAKKVARTWSPGPRRVMREPQWLVFHWLLVGLALAGLAILIWQRRWEALLLGLVLLAISAISALLVASPRRVLVLVPLLAALAGFAAAWLGSEVRRGRRARAAA